MSYFKVNLKSVELDSNLVSESIKNYESNISVLKNMLLNVDSCWKDLNTAVFLDNLIKDYNKFCYNIDSTKKHINNISVFCERIKYLLKQKGYEDVKTFECNSSYIFNAISDLDNCIYQLNSAVSKLRKLNIPLDFEYRTLLKNYIDYYKLHHLKRQHFYTLIYYFYLAPKMDYIKSLFL